jgi:hypothetical protein
MNGGRQADYTMLAMCGHVLKVTGMIRAVRSLLLRRTWAGWASRLWHEGRGDPGFQDIMRKVGLLEVSNRRRR